MWCLLFIYFSSFPCWRVLTKIQETSIISSYTNKLEETWLIKRLIWVLSIQPDASYFFCFLFIKVRVAQWYHPLWLISQSNSPILKNSTAICKLPNRTGEKRHDVVLFFFFLGRILVWLGGQNLTPRSTYTNDTNGAMAGIYTFPVALLFAQKAKNL